MKLLERLQSSSLGEIRAFLEADPLLMKAMDAEGTPLSFYAARRGDPEIMRWVVEYSRADMNERDSRGRNLLFPALESGNLELLQYLTERVGIDPLQPDRDLVTPLAYAEQLGSKQLSAYLAGRTALDPAKSYHNPVRRGFAPDPSVVRVGDDYYMVNSSFVSFPCLPISHSRDLVHWQTIGHAVSNPEWIDLTGLDSGRGFWAPDISFHKGKFYIIATFRLNDTENPMRRQMVVSSDKPEGPYSRPHFLEEDGIDPSLFADGDRRYLLLNRGVRIFEVDDTAEHRLGETSLLYYGDTKKATEAPHLLKHNGYYYLFMAEGGTGQGHQVNVARAKELFGIYEACPYNPILTQKDAQATLQRAGHGKPVQTAAGDWYMFYLGSRQYENNYSVLGRESFLDSITWTPDGWPLVNHLHGPSAIAALPLPRYEVHDDRSFGDHELAKDWYFIRNPLPGSYSVQDGDLRLRCGNLPPSDKASRQILLQRQREANCRAQVTIASETIAPGGNGGLMLYYDENSWLYLSVERREGDLFCFLRVREGEQEHSAAEQKIRGDQLRLQVDIAWPQYDFYLFCDEDKLFSHSVTTRILTDEGVSQGKRFTGPGVGVFGQQASGQQNLLFSDFGLEDRTR